MGIERAERQRRLTNHPRTRRDAFAQLQKRPLDRKEENGCGGVDENFDEEERDCRSWIDAVIDADPADKMDREFLHEVRAVGDAGDERDGGNFHSR